MKGETTVVHRATNECTRFDDLKAIRSNLRAGKHNALLKGGLHARRALRLAPVSTQNNWTITQYLLLCLASRRSDLINSLFIDAGFDLAVSVTFDRDKIVDPLTFIWSQSDRDCRFIFPNISLDQIGLATCSRWLNLRQVFQTMVHGGNIENVVVDLGDAGTHDGVAFCDNREYATLIPDCDFLSSNGYAEARKFFATAMKEWNNRSHIAFWRGTSTGVATEAKLLPRVRLCLLAREHPDLLDCGITGLSQISATDALMLSQLGLQKSFSPWQNLVETKFHVDIDGNSNAWSALFLKLLSGGLVFKVTSPFNFRQWFYPLMQPWVHYVPVASDLSDLIPLLCFFRQHDEIAAEIARRGRQLALSLTLESQLEVARAQIEKHALTKAYDTWKNRR